MDKAKFLREINRKKRLLDSFRPLSPELAKNLDDWFRVELTYTSNAIEGNTLSRQETSLIVEKGVTVAGKTVQEHLEATNHVEALAFVHSLVAENKTISEQELLKIHRLILQKIDDPNAGKYRSVSVRIAGSTVVLPNPLKVPDLMTGFFRWLEKDEPSNDVVALAMEAHFKLVSIHPFTDGNGRCA